MQRYILEKIFIDKIFASIGYLLQGRIGRFEKIKNDVINMHKYFSMNEELYSKIIKYKKSFDAKLNYITYSFEDEFKSNYPSEI